MTILLNRVQRASGRTVNPGRMPADIVDLFYDYYQLFTAIRAQLQSINQRF